MSRKPGAPAAGQAWAPFEAAVLPHVDRLFRLALWFERDRSEAEDLVQEAMRLAGAVFRAYRPTLSRSVRATVRYDHVQLEVTDIAVQVENTLSPLWVPLSRDC